MELEDIPTLELDPIEKGEARGGKYYRRTPKAGGGWNYFYTKEQYERAHGDAAHSHGPDVSRSKSLVRARGLLASGTNVVTMGEDMVEAARGAKAAKDMKTMNGIANQIMHALAHGHPALLASHGTEKAARKAWCIVNIGSTDSELRSAIDATRAGAAKREKPWHETASPPPAHSFKPYEPEKPIERRGHIPAPFGGGYEKSMRLVVSTDQFFKAGSSASHKYVSRKSDGKGGYIYTYASEGEAVPMPTKLDDAHAHVANAMHKVGAKKGADLAVHVESSDDRRPASEAGQYHQIKVYGSGAGEHARHGRFISTPGRTYGSSKKYGPVAVSMGPFDRESRAANDAFVKHFGASSKKHGQPVEAAKPKKPKAQKDVPVQSEPEPTQKSMSVNERENAMELENTPALRAQIKMVIAQEQPLAKGLYAFEPPYNSKGNKIPDEYLAAYLDAFIEEAFENERREKEHDTNGVLAGISQNFAGGEANGGAGSDEADWWAQWVMHELVIYCGKNQNLLRACEKHSATKDYVAGRLRSMGLIKPTMNGSEINGDFMEGYQYSEEQTKAGIGKSLTYPRVSEDAMVKALDRTLSIAAPEDRMVKLEDDGLNPVEMLANHHNARFRLMEEVYDIDLGMGIVKR